MPRQPRVAADRNISHRADGRWEVRLTVTDRATGKRERISRYADTRTEARRIRDRLERDEAGGGVRLEADRLTVAEWLAEWLETVVAQRAESTQDGRRGIVARHLVPALGAHRLSALTPRHVQRFVADQAAAGLAPSTVRNHLTVLTIALNHAVRMEVLERNPARAVERPARGARPRETLTAPQVAALLAHCEAHDRRLAAAVALAAGLALRRGELLGLRWADVDMEAGTLTVAVQQTVVGAVRLDQPLKTAASAATLPLPAPVARVLARWREEQATWQRARGLPPAALVLTTRTGRPCYASTLHDDLARATGACGLPPASPHDLRHSCASMLAALGVHPVIAQRILRHATPTLTLGLYTHVTGGQVADAATLLGERLTTNPTPTPADIGDHARTTADGDGRARAG